MYEVLMVIYLLIALGLIGLVLVQQGKGASMGASFGAGASNTVFGSGGSGNFMTRTTAILATLFFVISLLLGAMSNGRGKPTNDFSDLSKPAATQQAPKAAGATDTKKDADVPN